MIDGLLRAQTAEHAQRKMMIDRCDEGQQHPAAAIDWWLAVAHMLITMRECAGADFDHIIAEAHPASATLQKDDLALEVVQLDCISIQCC